jgi:hypothetical protein
MDEKKQNNTILRQKLRSKAERYMQAATLVDHGDRSIARQQLITLRDPSD